MLRTTQETLRRRSVDIVDIVDKVYKVNNAEVPGLEP